MTRQFFQSLDSAVGFFANPNHQSTTDGVPVMARATLRLKADNAVNIQMAQKMRDTEQLQLLAAKQKTDADIWLKKLNGQNRDLMNKITDDIWGRL